MRNILIAVFALALVLALTSTSNAQLTSASAGAVYTGSIIGELTLDAADGEITDLSRGYTYTLDADVNAVTPVTPVINGSEAGTPMNFAVEVDPGSNVTLSFILPTFLIGATAGNLPCSFPSNGLYWEETGQRFDPNSPVSFQVGVGGAATFDLGITVTVPVTAAVDDYTATVSCLATISGF